MHLICGYLKLFHDCDSSREVPGVHSAPPALMSPSSGSLRHHEQPTVQRWQITETELGHGGFGRVFLGMNSDTGELIAVKQIRIDPSDSHQKNVCVFVCEKLFYLLHS